MKVISAVNSDTSAREVAVAIVAIARYLATQDQGLGRHLSISAESAKNAGIPERDLRLVRMLVSSLAGNSAT